MSACRTRRLVHSHTHYFLFRSQLSVLYVQRYALLRIAGTCIVSMVLARCCDEWRGRRDRDTEACEEFERGARRQYGKNRPTSPVPPTGRSPPLYYLFEQRVWDDGMMRSTRCRWRHVMCMPPSRSSCGLWLGGRRQAQSTFDYRILSHTGGDPGWTRDRWPVLTKSKTKKNIKPHRLTTSDPTRSRARLSRVRATSPFTRDSLRLDTTDTVGRRRHVYTKSTTIQ